MAILLLGMVPVDASAATSQLTCAPTILGFGATVVGQTETLPVTVTNNGQASMTISGVTASNSEFTESSSSLPLVLLAGQSVELNVSFTPTTMGWTGGTIKFVSNAVNAILPLEVRGTGVSSEAVTASPSVVSFGQVATGTISTVPVVLYERSLVEGDPLGIPDDGRRILDRWARVPFDSRRSAKRYVERRLRLTSGRKDRWEPVYFRCRAGHTSQRQWRT